MSKNNPKKPPKYEQGQRPWRDQSTFAGGPGQKWTLWASWGVLGVAALMCAAIWFATPTNTTHAAGPAPAAGARHTAAQQPAEQVCPESPSTTDIPDAAPTDLLWKALYGNTWPVSPSVGPKKTVDGVAECFQHSPIGAALAAVNIIQTSRVNDTPTALKILDQQFVHNKGQALMRQQMPVTYSTQPPQGRVWGRVVGFKVESYRPGQAVLLLVENWPQRGQYTGYDITVVWQDGDWKVQLTDDAQTSLNGTITVDPAGFTPWEKAATQ